MRSNNKRAHILEAAFSVVAEQGANRLTIDAVAAESGFSKGGVLYHFPSKNALLTGMLDFLLEANMNRSKNQDTGSLLARLIEGRQGTDTAERRASLALLTAFSESTEMLEPVRSQMSTLFKESVEDADERDEAATLFFANEGIRFLELFEISPINRRETKTLSQHLVRRAENLE